jgi:MFS family permease
MDEKMSRVELRAGASLASVYGLRMLGLFFILPIFAIHAEKLEGGGNLTLVGLALGAYGLSQGVLQIPFGMASDRWGRKPAIYVGLVIFAAGSFLGIAADDIWTAIAARTLQGAGAINSVAMALAADLTREQHRTKIMAMIGATIGVMFAISLVAAPTLYRAVGMGGVFALTGLLSLAAILVVKFLVPDPSNEDAAAPAAEGGQRRLFDKELLRLNAGIFILHVVLYAMFVVTPTLIVQAGLPLSEHWKLYLPVVLGSFVLMVPAVFYADRRSQAKPVLIGGVVLLAFTELVLALAHPSVALLAGLMLAFFIAFNVLEAMLPSLVSRMAPKQGRGVAIGVYNTTQTLGVFCGGLFGGWMARHHGAGGVFMACAVLCGLWLAIAAGMRPLGRPVNGLSSATF